MNPAYAVIGLGYGDEGKGLTTDYLTRQLTVGQSGQPIVARGNGGAQAGHTVVTQCGRRHVFGHLSAGSFAGADTYLARNFIVNPYVLAKELDEVRISPNAIQVHAGCRVSVVFDMALNGLREMSREQRHGSCGLGINETVNRHDAGFFTTFYDVICMSKLMLQDELKRIFDCYWYPQYIELKDKVGSGASDLIAIFENPNFEAAAERMSILRKVRVAHPYDPPGMGKALIVEGAQGLMLDEYLGSFPHVTRSITGLPSALLAAHELGYREIHPIYVTRAYATRHGAGKLHSEGEAFTNKQVPADKTNVTGPWQGNFRYAPLSLSGIATFMQLDLNRSKSTAELLGIQIKEPKIMLTCMDQLGDEVATRRFGGKIEWTKSSDLPKLIEDTVGVKVKFVSYGETAQDVCQR